MKLVERDHMVYAEVPTAIGTMYLRDFTKPDTEPAHATNYTMPEIISFEDIYEDNIRANKKLVDAGAPLHDMSPKEKLLICGDGPSLPDHNYEISRHKLRLMALNRAASKVPLGRNDFVIVAECREFEIRVKLLDSDPPFGIFSPFSHPGIVKMDWRQRLFFTYGAQNLGTIELSRNEWPNLPHFTSSPLVGFTALEAAWTMGFRDIGIVGYDLARAADGRWRARHEDVSMDPPERSLEDQGNSEIMTVFTRRGRQVKCGSEHELMYAEVVAHAIAFIRAAGGKVTLFGDSIVRDDALGNQLEISDSIPEWLEE